MTKKRSPKTPAKKKASKTPSKKKQSKKQPKKMAKNWWKTKKVQLSAKKKLENEIAQLHSVIDEQNVRMQHLVTGGAHNQMMIVSKRFGEMRDRLLQEVGKWRSKAEALADELYDARFELKRSKPIKSTENEPGDSNFYTLREAAALSRLSVKTLRNWRYKTPPRPPESVIVGGQIMFPREAFDLWLKQEIEQSRRPAEEPSS